MRSVVLAAIIVSIPISASAAPTIDDVKREPFGGGSLVFDSDPLQTQLEAGNSIPFRLSKLKKNKQLSFKPPSSVGSNLRSAKPAPPVFDLKDDPGTARYGVMKVLFVSKDEVRLELRFFDPNGVLGRTTTITVQLNTRADIDGDGHDDLEYVDTLRRRPRLAERRYLTFITSRDELRTTMYAYNPGLNPALKLRAGLLGINADGHAVIHPTTDTHRLMARPGSLVEGDLVLDAPKSRYVKIPISLGNQLRKGTRPALATVIADSTPVDGIAKVASVMSWQPPRRNIRPFIDRLGTRTPRTSVAGTGTPGAATPSTMSPGVMSDTTPLETMSATSSRILTSAEAYTGRMKGYKDIYNDSLLKKTVRLDACGTTEVCIGSGAARISIGFTQIDVMFAVEPDISVSFSHVEGSLDVLFILESSFGVKLGNKNGIVDTTEALFEKTYSYNLVVPGVWIVVTASITPSIGLAAKLDLTAKSEIGVHGCAVFGASVDVDVGWDGADGQVSSFKDYFVYPAYGVQTKIGAESFIGPYIGLELEVDVQRILYARIPAILRLGPAWQAVWKSATNIVEVATSLLMAFEWRIIAGAKLEITIDYWLGEYSFYRSWEPINKELPGYEYKFWEATYRTYPLIGDILNATLFYPISSCTASQVISESGTCVPECAVGLVMDSGGACIDPCPVPKRWESGQCVCDKSRCNGRYLLTRDGCHCVKYAQKPIEALPTLPDAVPHTKPTLPPVRTP